jgi:hypothetical protein
MGPIGFSRIWQDAKKVRPGLFWPRKAKNVIFALLHFQTLVVFENGGRSFDRTAVC